MEIILFHSVWTTYDDAGFMIPDEWSVAGERVLILGWARDGFTLISGWYQLYRKKFSRTENYACGIM